ncbi:hypothetical protein F5Y17DRAFT_477006 [Xylariaceae sp. FL0594]|nr:hypothetical protein F5Y17DRAFT_477006 [Xylariaceae sp. FL0594]
MRFRHLLRLTSLFILSMPQTSHGAETSWGFKALFSVIPSHFLAEGAADYFWQPPAAVSLVSVINSAGFLLRIFTTRVAQFLGGFSFALYLVHMLILHSLGFQAWEAPPDASWRLRALRLGWWYGAMGCCDCRARHALRCGPESKDL